MHTKLLITRREAGLMLTGLVASAARPARAEKQPAKPHKLRASPRNVSLRGKDLPPTEIWNLDDGGDFFTAQVGEECVIEVQNGINLPLSLHFHGARAMPNAMDGVGGLTQESIPFGGTFTYRFTPQETGTWLIRPCVIGHTSELAGRGLTRLLMVEDPRQPLTNGGFQLIIDDWLLADSQLAPFAKNTKGRLGNLLTINNHPVPLDVEANATGGGFQSGDNQFGGRHLVRIANACNARSFRVRFDRMKAFVVAIDGQPTEAFEPLRASLPFSPGNRYDILIELPEDGPDAAITALLGSEIQLATFKARPRNAMLTTEIPQPEPNPLLPQAIRLQDALRVDVPIHAFFGKRKESRPDPAAPDMWALGITATSGSPQEDKPLFSVKSGRPVVLTVNNNTRIPQPIHIHGHSFRVLHSFDDGWDPYWKDTQLVPAEATMRIAFIAGSPGKWLIASTICEHFDSGLWGWFEVS